MRDALPRELPQFGFGRDRARRDDDEGMGRLAPFFVGETHHGHFLHRGMPQEYAFDFNR